MQVHLLGLLEDEVGIFEYVLGQGLLIEHLSIFGPFGEAGHDQLEIEATGLPASHADAVGHFDAKY